MKKMVKRIVAIALSVLMAFSFSVTAFAADTDPSITIINTNDAVSMKGHTYAAYKVFNVTTIAGTEKDTYDYTIVDSFKDFFIAKGCDTDIKAYDYVSKLDGDDAALQALAKELYAYAAEKGITPAATGKATSENLVIPVPSKGYYLVYDQGTDKDPATNGEKVVAAVSLNNVIQNAVINLKADAPKLDKTITGIADAATNEAGALDKKAVDAQIGKHIQFELNSTVPDLTGYTDYTYTITDTFSTGLTNDKNVKIMIGDTDVTAQSVITYDGQKFTATVPYDVLKGFAKGTAIVVTYSALLNKDAVAYDQFNSNIANLTYSNNPQDLTSKDKTPDSEVKVYTFTLDVTKTNNKGEVLQGAEFELRDGEGNLITVSEQDGRYVIDPEGTTTTLVSDANGKIYVKGLSAGNYTLTETKAPEGYNPLTAPVDFTVEVTYDLTAPTEITNVKGTEQTIINRTGGLLPSTGGIGTTIFTAAGIAIMVGAAALLIVKRKRVTE